MRLKKERGGERKKTRDCGCSFFSFYFIISFSFICPAKKIKKKFEGS